jgi:4-amino-4-deoxy-L-arabinose transferase-like glycosyltransferase
VKDTKGTKDTKERREMSRKRQVKGKKDARPVAGASPRAWWILPLFLCCVFAVKLLVLAQLQDHPLIQPDGGVDSAAYVRLARQVLGGDITLGPGLYYLSPLYIYFLAAALAATDSYTAVRVVQAILGTAAVWCVFVTATLWFGRRAGWLAAALAAMTGVFAFYEILILQASLDAFLTAAALACLAFGLTSGVAGVPASNKANVAAGILFGLQTLNRPNVVVAAAGVALALVLVRRWRAAACVVAGMALALAPVVARNVIVSRQFALSSSHGGLNFYIGNNAEATGQYGTVPGVRGNVEGQSEDTRKVAEQAAGHPLTDAEVSNYFTNLALGWVRANPGRAAALFVRKLALVFNARHQWLDFSYPYYAYDTGAILRFMFVGPWLLVPLGFAGMATLIGGSTGSSGSRGSGFSARLVWLSFIPFYAIGVAIFFVAERYRLPLFIPLCVCAGGALDELLEAFQKPSPVLPPHGSVWIAVAAAAVGVVVTAWPFPLNNGRYDERLAISKVLMNRRDYGAAAVELQAAYELQPTNTVTEFNLGVALVSLGRASDGLAHLRHAVDANVPVPGARYVLANAMLTSGDRDGAVALLRTFYPAENESAESCFQAGALAMRAGAPRVAERFLQRALDLRPSWDQPAELLQQLRR